MRLVPATSLAAACWTVAVVSAFPWLVQLSLSITVVCTAVPLLMLVRLVLTALILAPLGVAMGICLVDSRSPVGGSTRGSITTRMLVSGLTPAIGIAIGQLVLLPGRGPVPASIIAAVALGAFGLLSGAIPWMRTGGWKLRTAAACGVAVLAASPWLVSNYRPASSARLLFNANIAIARHAGLENRFLTVMDESRLAASAEGDRSTFTVWQSRGSQFLVRENGMPRGAVSVRPVICPQNPNELMLAVLPLTLHEAPHRVLLLGAGSGLGVLAAKACPVQTTLCVEPERALLDLLARHAWPQDEQSPLRDDRLSFHTLEPAVALAAVNESWNIIVSNPRPSAAVSGAGEFAREFYAAASGRLAEDGLFCQRFTRGDYGPQPILTAVRTLQSVFRDVTIIEPGPGELLLFATNSDKGVVREGFTNRLQSDHIRRLLSQAGWDWTVPLTLNAYRADTLREMTAKAPVNTVASGRFAFRLPQEMMRWALKGNETAAVFAAKATRVVAWPTIDGTDPDLLERISEIAGQKNLMANFVDQPWAYRKTLREQLAKSKKSLIRQAAAATEEEKVHPVDQHRKEYFSALGICTRQANPKLNDVNRLEEFVAPYDPLISYFVHHELAELHARRSNPDRTAELEHRLHMAWYALPGDRSVRQITRALELLNDDAAGLDPVTRWDQTNALLQLLLSHWENRSAAKPGPTHITLKDIDLSISASEKSMSILDTLAAETGTPADEWAARRAILERALIRPLRTLRSQLLPKSFAEDRTNREAMQESAAQPPATE